MLHSLIIFKFYKFYTAPVILEDVRQNVDKKILEAEDIFREATVFTKENFIRKLTLFLDKDIGRYSQ